MEDVNLGIWVQEYNDFAPVQFAHNRWFFQFWCAADYYTAPINLLARWCACGTILGKAKLAAATSDDIVEAIILLVPWFINIILVFSNQKKKQIGHPMRKFDHLPVLRFWVMLKLLYVSCGENKIFYLHFIRHLFFWLVYQYLICSSFPNKDTITKAKKSLHSPYFINLIL